MNKKNRKQVLYVCGILYFICQISRTDLGAVLVDMLADLGFGKETFGAVITAGYVAYAVGMLVNSQIADRVNPKSLLCIALFVCTGTHLGIRLLPVPGFIFALWLINGYAQSMVWPAMLNLFSQKFPIGQREQAMGLVSLFKHAGSLSCYVIVSAALKLGGWRTMMSLTSAACLSMGLVCSFGRVLNSGQETSSIRVKPARMDRAFLRFSRLPLFLLLGCLCGMLRDRVQTWAPVFFSECFSADPSISVLLTSLLPGGNILMCVVFPFLSRWDHNKRRQLIAVFSIAIVFSLLLLIKGISLLPAAILVVGILCSATFGDMYFTISYPLLFARIDRAASMSGLLDSMLYVGAALSSYLYAFLAESGGWQAVILAWGLISAIAVVILLIHKMPTIQDCRTS